MGPTAAGGAAAAAGEEAFSMDGSVVLRDSGSANLSLLVFRDDERENEKKERERRGLIYRQEVVGVGQNEETTLAF